jgi:Tfp pilus assembly protein PilF
VNANMGIVCGKRCGLGVAAIAAAFLAYAGPAASARQNDSANQTDARALIAQGVQAFKNGQFDAAAADFQRAKELDPSSKTARLYLATTYASEYIPGAPA